jgi:hypothetical protein
MSILEAIEYAKKHVPSKKTKRLAYCEAWNAYLYALEIDKEFHEDIWEATKNTEYEEKYKNFFNQI